MPLSSTTASTEQSRPGLQAAFSLSGPFTFASDTAPCPCLPPPRNAQPCSRRTRSTRPPARRPRHRAAGGRRSGLTRKATGPQALELFDRNAAGLRRRAPRPRRKPCSRSRPSRAPPRPEPTPQPSHVQVDAPAPSAPSPAPAGRPRAERGAQARPASSHQVERSGQAVRAGHQRAAARPDVPVPLRGTRHLPADDRAGRARRPQEGHDRSGAQRPPDQPHARRAGRRPGRRHRQGPEARHHRPSARPAASLFFQTSTARLHAADEPAAGQGRQPDPGRASRPCARNMRRAEVVLVSKDINMRVKARALGLATDDYQNDKTLEDGDLLYSGSLALPADFWTRQSKTIESWQQGSHTFYRITGPSCGSLLINQFVFFEAPGEPPHVRPRHRNPGQDRGAEDPEGLQPPQKRRLGRHHAQPRAELRHEPADGPGGGLRHAGRHGRHRQDADGAGLGPARRCSTTAATPKSS